jgi:hypothetical protein
MSGPRVDLHRRAHRSEAKAPVGHVFVPPVRLRKLLWLPAIIGVAWAVHTYGTPHLRFSYEYSGSYDHPTYLRCTYVGWHSTTIRPSNGQCPLFLFFRSEGE